jgi:hypothetical protein
MNKLTLSLCVGAVLVMAPLSRSAEPSGGGEIDFGDLKSSKSGGEFVEVNLNRHLIALVARLAAKQEPEAAELLGSIQSVRVNVIGLKEDNTGAVKERMEKVRASLATGGWTRIVTAQKETEDVGVYLKLRGEEAVEGLVVTVLEADKEAVFINIVGDIRPEKLAELGEKLGLEPLKRAGKTVEKS